MRDGEGGGCEPRSVSGLRLLGAGGGAFAVTMLAALLLWGNPLTRRLLLTPEFGQSDKLLAVWLYIPPRPKLDVWDPQAFFSPGQLQMFALLFLLTLAHAWIYGAIRGALPGQGWRKGVGFGVGIWLFSYVFFELFTPFNLFGEPLHLLAYQLTLWLALALIEGCAIAALVEVGLEGPR